MKGCELIQLGILTVSDRCSRNERGDKSGPALKTAVEEKGWTVSERLIVADEMDEIKTVLINWTDQKMLRVILTTGGTGLGPRDVTPEATRAVIEKEIPGLAEWMRLNGRNHTLLAPLSRSLAGVRKKTLIVNFPGNPMGAIQSFKAISDLLPHALEMLDGHTHNKGTVSKVVIPASR